MRPARASAAVPRLGTAAVGMLEGLDRHRLLSTVQLHELYTPRSSLRWTQLLLSPEQAAGPLQEHTLAVNEAGLAFVRAARERGDECGPLAWHHEVVHSLGRPPGQRRAELLLADALLTYRQNEPGEEVTFHYRFVELDRATMGAERLASQLARYARLYHRTVPATDPLDEPEPAWAKLYPVFPAVMVVIAGLPPDRAERRRDIALELLADDPDLADAAGVSLSIGSLEDLVSRGPFAPIFREVRQPQTPDWLGQAAE